MKSLSRDDTQQQSNLCVPGRAWRTSKTTLPAGDAYSFDGSAVLKAMSL